VFAVSYAMACCLGAWGIRPSAAIGHSLGEYVAATIAGIFSLKTAIDVVCWRADAIARLPAGAMLAVAAHVGEIAGLLDPAVDVAAINADRAVVVSGPPDAIARTQARLVERDVSCRRLPAAHAFHSRLLDAVRQPLADRLGAETLQPASVPLVSNASGGWLAAYDATDPWYWARQMCRTVRFREGLECLLEHSSAPLIEVGPGTSLGSFARNHESCTPDRVSSILSTIPLVHVRHLPLAFFRTTLGKLWLAGVDVDWDSQCAG
jgi:acyl transferase domain-containing protein